MMQNYELFSLMYISESFAVNKSLSVETVLSEQNIFLAQVVFSR